MSARAIVSGAIGKIAEFRTSKNGNPFATLSIRENHDGATRWWQAIAFSESAIEVLKEMSVGEPVAVTGEITAEIYSPAGSESRINWRITVDAVLSARRKAKPAAEKPKATRAKQSYSGRAVADTSWASPAMATEGQTPHSQSAFDDQVPF
jgi:single-stranded DNA-binding protein